MINPIHSNLYKLTSKKYLLSLLHIHNRQFLKQSYVSKQISPYIQTDPKPRLIEVPSEELKTIQRHIKNELNKIIVPANIFSGIKGKSYIGNAKLHSGNKYVFKIDLCAFFPCITRNTVYNFFIESLKTSPDIANILTNLLTVDLSKCSIENVESVNAFLISKKIKTSNHLISGSPASQILSYLVNHKMFDSLQNFCDKNNITMSVYVDDVTFSSQHIISHTQKQVIYKIISKNLYRLSRNKVKYYTKKYPKLITGVVISSNGNLKIKNSLSLNVISEWKYFSQNPKNLQSKDRLQGLLIAARQSEPAKFQNIYNLIREASIPFS